MIKGMLFATLSAAVGLFAGLAYWCQVQRVLGVQEAWDSDGYLSWAYPTALALCAMMGFLTPRYGWLIATLFVFAQLPAMEMEPGPLLSVGVAFAIVLTTPGILVALLAGVVRRLRA